MVCLNFVARLLCLAVLGAAGGTVGLAADNAAEEFAEVRQILQRNCIACHHAGEAEGGLNLETREAIVRGGDNGAAIQPGQGKHSLLWQRMSGEEDPIMPPEDNEVGAQPLTQEELELMARWIDAGAPLDALSSNAALHWQPLPENLQPIYATATTTAKPLAAYGLGQQVWLRYFDAQGQTLASLPLADTAPSETTPGAIPAADIVSSLAISRDGQIIAVGGFRKLDLWRFDGGPQPLTAALPAGRSDVATFVSASGQQIAQVLPASEESPEAQFLLVHGPDGSPGRKLQLPTAAVRQVLWSADESRLAAYLQDGTLLEFTDSPTPAAVHSLGADKHALVWLADNRIAGLSDSNSASKQLDVWKAGEDAAAPWLRDESFASLANADQLSRIVHQRAVLAVLREQRVVVLLAADGTEVARLDHGSEARGFAVQTDGKRLISFGPQGLPKIWDVDKAALQGELPWTQARIDAVAVAQRDLDRQKAKLGRLNPRLAPLQATVKTQTEAVAKAVEEHTKAVADVASKTEAHAAAEQAVQKTEQTIAALQDDAGKDSEGNDQAVAAQQAELKKQQEALQKAAAALAESQQALIKREQILASTRDAQLSAETAVAKLTATIESETQFLESLQQALDAAIAVRDQPLPATTHVAFTPDGRFVVAATNEAQSIVLSTAGWQECARLETDESIQRISITASGRILGHRAQDVVQHSWPLLGRWHKAITLGGEAADVFADRVTAIDIDAHSQRVAAGSGLPSRDGTLTIFSTNDGQVLQRFDGVHSDSIMGVAFAPDGRSIASVAADKLVRVSALDAQRPPITLEGHGHHVLAVAWHPDGYRLATASADQTVRVWDTESARQLRSIGGFGNEATALRFVGDSNQIAVSAGKSAPRLVDINNGSTVRNFPGARDYVYSLSILRGNQLLLGGDHSGNLTLWNLVTGTEVK